SSTSRSTPSWRRRANSDPGGRSTRGGEHGPSGATRCTPRPQSRWDVALAVRAADAPRTGGLLLLARDPDGLLLVHDLGSLRRLRVHRVEELDRPAGVRGGPAG